MITCGELIYSKGERYPGNFNNYRDVTGFLTLFTIIAVQNIAYRKMRSFGCIFCIRDREICDRHKMWARKKIIDKISSPLV